MAKILEVMFPIQDEILSLSLVLFPSLHLLFDVFGLLLIVTNAHLPS